MTHPLDEPWPRWRLLATLGGIAAVTLALLVGLVLAFIGPRAPRTATADAAATLEHQPTLDSAGRREAIAAAPMLRVPPSAAYTPDVAVAAVEPMRLPDGDTTGGAGVATGFPRTPEGAVAQLAAIEIRVVEAMSIPVARDVHRAWVTDGGPSFADWELTRGVQSFLTAAGIPEGQTDESVLITATPAGALVKGTDGPDWVLACVLLDVRASIATDARIGYGHCSRMTWSGGRWLVAPGAAPAPAPSVWPGSSLAVDAGWRPVVEG